MAAVAGEGEGGEAEAEQGGGGGFGDFAGAAGVGGPVTDEHLEGTGTGDAIAAEFEEAAAGEHGGVETVGLHVEDHGRGVDGADAGLELVANEGGGVRTAEDVEGIAWGGGIEHGGGVGGEVDDGAEGSGENIEGAKAVNENGGGGVVEFEDVGAVIEDITGIADPGEDNGGEREFSTAEGAGANESVGDGDRGGVQRERSEKQERQGFGHKGSPPGCIGPGRRPGLNRPPTGIVRMEEKEAQRLRKRANRRERRRLARRQEARGK